MVMRSLVVDFCLHKVNTYGDRHKVSVLAAMVDFCLHKVNTYDDRHMMSVLTHTVLKRRRGMMKGRSS